MRTAIRLLAVACCAVAFVVALPASPAGAASDDCGPGDLDGLTFAVDGGAPVGDLADLGPLSSGMQVEMAWTDAAEGCADDVVSLAAYRVDSSPVDDLADGGATCAIESCGGSLTYEVPPRTAVCAGELVAATTSPRADLAEVGAAALSSTTIDDGTCSPPAPSASATLDCSQGGVEVLLENDGELDATFDISVDGQPHETVEVGPRTETGARSVTRVVPVAEDEFVTVVVASGGTVLDERLWLVDCEGPTVAPSLTLDCAAGGARLEVDNFSQAPVTYEVVVGGEVHELVVNPFTSERFPIALAEDTATDVVVNGPDGEVLNERLTKNCEVPRASASVDCQTGSVAFSLGNDGETPTLIDLLRDGEHVVGIPVPPLTELEARLDLGEGPVSAVAARSNGTTLVDIDLPVGCGVSVEPTVGPSTTIVRDQVLGVSLSNTADGPPAAVAPAGAPAGDEATDAKVLGNSLARTGAEPLPLVLSAGSLLCLGGFFLLQSGRRLGSTV